MTSTSRSHGQGTSGLCGNRGPPAGQTRAGPAPEAARPGPRAGRAPLALEDGPAGHAAQEGLSCPGILRPQARWDPDDLRSPQGNLPCSSSLLSEGTWALMAGTWAVPQEGEQPPRLEDGGRAATGHVPSACPHLRGQEGQVSWEEPGCSGPHQGGRSLSARLGAGQHWSSSRAPQKAAPHPEPQDAFPSQATGHSSCISQPLLASSGRGVKGPVDLHEDSCDLELPTFPPGVAFSWKVAGRRPGFVHQNLSNSLLMAFLRLTKQLLTRGQRCPSGWKRRGMRGCRVC